DGAVTLPDSMTVLLSYPPHKGKGKQDRAPLLRAVEERQMPRMFRVTLSLLLCLLAAPAFAQEGPVHDKPLSEAPRAQAVTAKNGMVVAQEALAAQIGVDILKAGGNAVDAAVATGFAMAVTYP